MAYLAASGATNSRAEACLAMPMTLHCLAFTFISYHEHIILARRRRFLVVRHIAKTYSGA